MIFDYEECEKKCEEIRTANEKLLEMFAEDLSNLSPRTSGNHISNVEFD